MTDSNQSKDPKQTQKPKKKGLFVPIFVGIIAFLAGIVVTMAVGFVLLTHSILPVSNGNGLNKITSVFHTIQENYYKPVSTTKLVNGAINGMVDSLGDPFSEYLAKQDASDLNNTISGSFGGIGASVKQSGDYVAVDSPIKNTPAAKAGLKTNDVILKVNGHSVAGKTTTQVVSKIRGKIGTKVQLTLKRGSKTFTVNLTRAKIPVKTVTGKIDATHKTVGDITISTFSEPTAKELKQTIRSLRKKGATSFVIDLRGNPGGALPTALATSSMFLKNGQAIMQVKARDGKAEVYRAGKTYDDGFKVKEPTVVLIDGDSASAAEIFASALKESAHDQVIGTQSYGKGTVQTVSDLGGSSEMKITTAKWLTPKGHWINHKGVTPTTKADYPAYAYLNSFDTAKTYQLGDSSRTIISVQKILQALGYDLDQTNGVYDASTQSAVKAFQTAHQLTATGTVDTKTGDALLNALATLISQHDTAYQKAVDVLTQ